MNPNVSKPKFGTDGWRGIIGEDFNSFNCLLVVTSLLKLSPNLKKIIIGYDTRELSYEISIKIKKYLFNKGIDTILSACPIPTPAVSFSVKNKGADLGIIITASHNSKIWNGIKIKNKYGQSISESEASRLTDIIYKEKIDMNEFNKFDLIDLKENDLADLLPDYINSIKKIIDVNKIKNSKLSLIVDCMNGTSKSILEKIIGGGECKISEINNNNDSSFPGIKQPEPIEENLSGLKLKVRELNADVGFAFDADSDRVGVIDNKTNYIEAPFVFCIIADHILCNKKINKNISTTVSMTSMIDAISKKYNINCFRTKVGFKYVAPNMEENDSIIGGEESGGYSYSEHLLERDGIVSSLLIIEKLIDSQNESSNFLPDLLKNYGNFFYKRLDIDLDKNILKKISDFISNYNSTKMIGKNIKSINKKDGIKINFEKNEWILIRLSGTEPLARIYAESYDEKSVNKLISDFIESFKN